jgi:hypothetical protein
LFWVKSQKQLDSLFSRLLVMRSEGKLNESLVVCKELISGYERLKDEEKALKPTLLQPMYPVTFIKQSLAYLDIASKK